MTPRKTLSRLALSSIAAAAIAAPTAVAKPINPPNAGKTFVVQDLRSPDAADPYRAPVRALPGPPTWPVNPQPITPASAAAADDGDGIDWQVPAIAIAGGLVFAGLGVKRSRIRTARPRVVG